MAPSSARHHPDTYVCFLTGTVWSKLLTKHPLALMCIKQVLRIARRAATSTGRGPSAVVDPATLHNRPKLAPRLGVLSARSSHPV
jgi:hypothetical protein